MRTYERMNFDLHEMLNLRRSGWSFSALGFKYGKDHTTIMHHCKKHGVVSQIPVYTSRGNVPRPMFIEEVRKNFIPGKYDEYLSQPTNPGKTYKQYLAEAKNRTIEKDYLENHRFS
jgi:hypothetical protein